MPNLLLLRFIIVVLFSLTLSCSAQTNNDITIIKNSALELIDKNSKIEVLGESFIATEGPLWDSENNQLIFSDVRQEDLIAFGLIPELVGRLPIISALDILDEDDMLKVLLEPKNSIIKQYQKLFLIEGIILEFQSSALKAVVKLALKKKAGARALRSVIEESLMEIMYCIPDMEGLERVIVTKNVILHGEEPVYDSGKKRKTA